MPAANNPHPHEDRITRLEEAIAFADRTAEHLSQEIAELNKRLVALTKRMASLEDRQRKAEAGPEDSSEP